MYSRTRVRVKTAMNAALVETRRMAMTGVANEPEDEAAAKGVP
jgi:hypothetical protein